MRIKVILTSVLLISIVPVLMSQDIYLDEIDSLLVSMGKLIKNDLSQEGIKVHQRPWIGFGDCFELEVVFDEKDSKSLTSLSRPDSLKKKDSKLNFSLYKKSRSFRDYIYENDELPYELFDYFNYYFLQAQTNGDSFNGAIFGVYRFNASVEGLSIIDNNIEILEEEIIILEKFNTEWSENSNLGLRRDIPKNQN